MGQKAVDGYSRLGEPILRELSADVVVLAAEKLARTDRVLISKPVHASRASSLSQLERDDITFVRILRA
jgi:hypothetical protein